MICKRTLQAAHNSLTYDIKASVNDTITECLKYGIFKSYRLDKIADFMVIAMYKGLVEYGGPLSYAEARVHCNPITLSHAIDVSFRFYKINGPKNEYHYKAYITAETSTSSFDLLFPSGYTVKYDADGFFDTTIGPV